MSFWACVQTKPKAERLAQYCLHAAHYVTYLPKILTHRVHNGRRREVSAPLFPGYLFLAIELQWSSALWMPGVVRLVANGTAPAKVPDEVIDGIRSRERDGLVELPRQKIKRGSVVRVLRGPFRDRLALYEEMTGPERVAVLLQLLGGPRQVTLPLVDVEVVEEA